MLKPSVRVRPSISCSLRPCPCELPAALPQEQRGVSECGWSGQGGRERARQGDRGRERELARLSCFPKRGEGGKDARKKERVSEKQRMQERGREQESKGENKLWDHICLPDVASSCLKRGRKKRF